MTFFLIKANCMHFKHWIDLSVSLENSLYSDPPSLLPKISYIDHQQSFKQMAHFFPGLKQEELPDGEAWAIEQVELSTHNGTHLDAPYHYATMMDKGKPAITVDEVPLEWCFKPGVKLDFTQFEDGYVATKTDLQQALKKIDYAIQPLDIILIHTRASQYYNTPSYLLSGCGIGREATLFLLEQGVRVTGTDAWSWDAPFAHTAAKYAKEKRADIIWEGHKAGRERGYCHLEKLCKLDQLPCHGFWVSCFPVKIKGASAGWTRAVALIP